jgi:SAM-dependent methyltransferase
MNKKFFLPGTDKQLKFLLDRIDLKDYKVLILGPGCEEISKQFLANGVSRVLIIVNNEDSLLITRLNLAGIKEITVRLMQFEATDFKDSQFDLVYAQGSVSGFNRNKILKEIKRILKPSCYFCAGEIVSLTKSPPRFVKDIWKNSDISPLFSDDLENYYRERNFEVISSDDISDTLFDFYRLSNDLMKEKSGGLTVEEKSYYKKLLKQISHESNVYLKLGGNVHIGFKVLILKKV